MAHERKNLANLERTERKEPEMEKVLSVMESEASGGGGRKTVTRRVDSKERNMII